MKRKLLIVVLVFMVVSGFSQVQQDQSDILQLCVDLPVLQSYLIDKDGNQLEQLYIKANGAFISQEPAVEKFGEPIRIVDKLEISALGIRSYIDFYIFDVSSQDARIDFNYSGENNLTLWVYAEFKKTATTWEITKLKSKEK